MTLPLRIQLLGDFGVTHGDAPLTRINTPRLQSLLAYLLLHRAAPQARQHIAFLLYPDSPEPQARGNLRNLLHRLRQALPHADLFLQGDELTIQWRADSPFTLDVDQFQSVAAANSATSLRQAIQLYRGELLPGIYDDWILPERERLHQQFIDALERFANLLESEGDYRSAIQIAERLLRADPLREDTYRQLMRLHSRSGNRAGALSVYRTCVSVLARELDAEVSAATREAYADLFKEEELPSVTFVAPALLRTNNLPSQLSSFIGREREIAEVCDRLSTARLVTLTGAGGSGKTRLALEAAQELLASLPDGAWFVDLAPLSDPTLVSQAVASALGVREQPGRALTDSISGSVRDKTLLLILDNCEHLVAACAQLAQMLLSSALGIRILATSRERLNIAGELVRRVPSLLLPETRTLSLETLMQSEAIRLFVERALSVLPTFALDAQNAPAILQICQRLDGIPLAIEMAAARVSLLSPAQIEARLVDRFDLLASGSRTALPRHQTLRATLDWSYALLSQEEQVLLRRLAVFAGGFTVLAAESVCSDRSSVNGKQFTDNYLLRTDILDLLSRLLDKSWLQTQMGAHGESRLVMLETIRQYAHQKLFESGEGEQLRGRHLDFYLKLAEDAEPKLIGADQLVWLNRIENEYDNLRLALEWSLGSDRIEKGQRIASALHDFWLTRGYWSEAYQRLLDVLRAPGADKRNLARGKTLRVAGSFANLRGDYETSCHLFEESVSISRELGKEGRALLEHALTRYAYILIVRDLVAARIYAVEAADSSRQSGNIYGLAQSLNMLGGISRWTGDFGASLRYFEESAEKFLAIGDKNMYSTVLGNMGRTLHFQNDLEQAKEYLERSIEISREIGNKRNLGEGMILLGDAARIRGQHDEAESLLEQAMLEFRELGDKFFMANALMYLGRLQINKGNHLQAEAYLKESLSLSREADVRIRILWSLESFAFLSSALNDSRRAARLFGAAKVLREKLGTPLLPIERTEYESYLAAARAQLDEAAFDAAWNEGAAMTPAQPIEYALRETQAVGDSKE